MLQVQKEALVQTSATHLFTVQCLAAQNIFIVVSNVIQVKSILFV